LQFVEMLGDLVRAIEGARGAIFLDADGEAVQWYPADESDRLRLRAAYLAVVVRSFRTSIARLELGGMSHLVIQYQKSQFVIEEIEEGGYFLVLELSSSANLAQCASRLVPAVATFRREIGL
jgi:predicted regulator of Ras-like GTPase activity (Roadblock/LC7/MglB family)